MTFEKAVRFVEPLLASEVAKKADFFAPEASHPKNVIMGSAQKCSKPRFWRLVGKLQLQTAFLA